MSSYFQGDTPMDRGKLLVSSESWLDIAASAKAAILNEIDSLDGDQLLNTSVEFLSWLRISFRVSGSCFSLATQPAAGRNWAVPSAARGASLPTKQSNDGARSANPVHE